MPRRSIPRAIAATLTALLLGFAGAIAVASPAAAATIVVTSNLDNGANTLRDAVTTANNQGSNDGLDTIQLNFGSPTTIMLTTGVITVLEGVVIQNIGAKVTISTDTDADLFELVPPVVETQKNFLFDGGPLLSGERGLELDGNRAGGIDGHGITTFDGTPINDLTLQGVEVREFSGDSESGAGVRVDGATGVVRITDCLFDDNDSDVSGGGLSVVDSLALFVTNGFFVNNEAFNRGGGIHASSIGPVEIHGTTFEENSADFGGGVSIDDSGIVTVDEGADFYDNSAATLGGGLNIDNLQNARPDVTIRASTFTSNDSGTGGGAFINGAGTVTVTDATRFQSNQATASNGRGGGLATNQVVSLDLTNTQWVSNVSEEAGGAVSTVGTGNHLIDLALFDLNQSVNGGAIAVRAPNFDPEHAITIAHSMISNNDAISDDAIDGHGGGVWIEFEQNTALPIDIIGNTFAGNEARNTITGVGGGVFIDRVSELTRIHDNTFTGNVLHPVSGYGISVAIDYMNGTDAEIDVVNSTFDEAFLPSGAAAPIFYLRAMDAPADLRIAHSTFVGPLGIQLDSMDGGDALLTHSALETSQNAVVWPDGETLDTEWSAFTQGPNPGNINNVTGNQFSLASLKLGLLQDNGNILPHTREPLTGSPLINTGNPAVTGQPPFDQRGEGFNRVIQTIDIGAVEVQKPVLAATGSSASPPIGVLALVLLAAGAVTIVLTRRHGAAPHSS